MTGRATGEELYQELCAAAAASGVSVLTFATSLWPAKHVGWKLEQLRIAQRPLRGTIERIRAAARGEDPPPARRYAKPNYDHVYQRLTRVECERLGLPPSKRHAEEQEAILRVTAEKARIELLRRLTEQASNDRRPGQTLADRVDELRQELAA